MLHMRPPPWHRHRPTRAPPPLLLPRVPRALRCCPRPCRTQARRARGRRATRGRKGVPGRGRPCLPLRTAARMADQAAAACAAAWGPKGCAWPAGGADAAAAALGNVQQGVQQQEKHELLPGDAGQVGWSGGAVCSFAVRGLGEGDAAGVVQLGHQQPQQLWDSRVEDLSVDLTALTDEGAGQTPYGTHG